MASVTRPLLGLLSLRRLSHSLLLSLSLFLSLFPLSPQAHVIHQSRPRIPAVLRRYTALHSRTLRQTKHAAAGPCSKASTIVEVFTASDFRKRWKFPPTRTVVLQVRKTIVLSYGLVFGRNFTCTIIRKRPGTPNVNLTYLKSDAPVVTVNGTSNIWFQGINILHFTSTQGVQPCNFFLFSPGKETNTIVCPAVYIVESFGVQLNQGSVYGRIDVFQSIYVLLDHLRVTGPPIYTTDGSYNSYRTHGFIRMGETTAGTSLIPSHNAILNCEVYGGWELITLHRGAVGVTVSRNFLHNFMFVGIRCGADVNFVMDCHLNSFTNNLIYNPPAYSSSITDINNAGIYTCTHFFNPGNYISCNYIYNQRWCIYLDFTSTGVTIDGGVCNGSYAAVKVNGGKFNKVRSLIVAHSSKFLHFTSCVSAGFGNCYNPTGNNWEAMRRKYWSTPLINQRYPRMSQICNPIPSSINQVSCNPPGAKYSAAVTGFCSGYSYGNDLQSFWFLSAKGTPYDYNSCKDDVNVNATAFNRQVAYNVTANPGFRGGGTPRNPADFGLLPKSRIYSISKTFKSCPRSTVGPTKLTPNRNPPYYYNFWNLRQPASFKDVISFNFGRVQDGSVTLPTSAFKVVGNVNVP